MEQTKQMIVEYNNTQIICEGTELQMIEDMSLEYIDSVQDIGSYDNGQYLIKLPIKSVNGLNCVCMLKFGYLTSERYGSNHTLIEKKKYYWVALKVFSNHLNLGEKYNFQTYQMYYDKKLIEDKSSQITHTDIMISIIKAKYILSNLKYCYFENELTLKPNKILSIASIFENPNVQLSCEDCAVCHNSTTNKTPCSHSLCFICWEQIKENEEDNIPCPLCREDISSVE
jgi:hypothetical protein